MRLHDIDDDLSPAEARLAPLPFQIASETQRIRTKFIAAQTRSAR